MSNQQQVLELPILQSNSNQQRCQSCLEGKMTRLPAPATAPKKPHAKNVHTGSGVSAGLNKSAAARASKSNTASPANSRRTSKTSSTNPSISWISISSMSGPRTLSNAHRPDVFRLSLNASPNKSCDCWEIVLTRHDVGLRI